VTRPEDASSGLTSASAAKALRTGTGRDGTRQRAQDHQAEPVHPLRRVRPASSRGVSSSLDVPGPPVDHARAREMRIATANARRAYRLDQQRFSSPRWQRLADRGAPKQRPRWASTGTKDPGLRRRRSCRRAHRRPGGQRLWRHGSALRMLDLLRAGAGRWPRPDHNPGSTSLVAPGTVVQMAPAAPTHRPPAQRPAPPLTAGRLGGLSGEVLHQRPDQIRPLEPDRVVGPLPRQPGAPSIVTGVYLAAAYSARCSHDPAGRRPQSQRTPAEIG
jgi:hypothetical protein